MPLLGPCQEPLLTGRLDAGALGGMRPLVIGLTCTPFWQRLGAGRVQPGRF